MTNHFEEMEKLGQISIFELEEEKGLAHDVQERKKEHKPIEGVIERRITSRTNSRGYITPRREVFICSR